MMLARSILRRFERGRPVDLVALGTYPSSNTILGLGLTPDQLSLLQETQGIPDTATRAIANRLSGLNPQVVSQRRSRGRNGSSGTVVEEVLDDHPMKHLLDHPHPNFSRLQMLRLLSQWCVATGDAYLLKVRSGFGVPTELHPVPPMNVAPLIGEKNLLRGYLITDANGKQREEAASELVRIWYPDPSQPWSGRGYLGPTGLAADSHKFASQHLRTFYQRDATPKTVLEAQPDAKPDPFANEEKRRRWSRVWQQHYGQRGGGEYLGTPGITPPGYKLVQLAMQTGKDFVPILEYLRDDILMSYFVPRSVLGQVVSGDRSSAEVNQWVMDRYAVEPITSLIADALTQQLAPDFMAVQDREMAGQEILVRFEKFVSDDKDYELAREAQDLKLKVRSVNQVREDRNDDPVEWGDDPIGTPQDVPYDPQAAAERANRPAAPQTSGAPMSAGTMEEEPVEMQKSLKHAEARAHGAVRQLFRKARERSAS